MSRKTILLAGANLEVPVGLREILEQKFGKNRYLVLFASDHKMAKTILAETPDSIIISAQEIDQMVLNAA